MPDRVNCKRRLRSFDPIDRTVDADHSTAIKADSAFLLSASDKLRSANALFALSVRAVKAAVLDCNSSDSER